MSVRDLGPISAVVKAMPPARLFAGICPSCGAWHVFVFVTGNHPERGRDANAYCVEPFPQDSARSPRA